MQLAALVLAVLVPLFLLPICLCCPYFFAARNFQNRFLACSYQADSILY
jgi:hypothetical protein